MCDRRHMNNRISREHRARSGCLSQSLPQHLPPITAPPRPPSGAQRKRSHDVMRTGQMLNYFHDDKLSAICSSTTFDAAVSPKDALTKTPLRLAKLDYTNERDRLNMSAPKTLDEHRTEKLPKIDAKQIDSKPPSKKTKT
ncbi:hypothetical protein NP493_335g01046 [Ridgeia piscesae]|uniref:Uncharacterized protein n=1 Tax=Ridgeia piscesae TaxID=27915 RepID=A0AAD9NVP5_RIDPI|nr:hypothetical protein NP493_335g01046 [Ridgeia piscesae]